MTKPPQNPTDQDDAFLENPYSRMSADKHMVWNEGYRGGVASIKESNEQFRRDSEQYKIIFKALREEIERLSANKSDGKNRETLLAENEQLRDEYQNLCKFATDYEERYETEKLKSQKLVEAAMFVLKNFLDNPVNIDVPPKIAPATTTGRIVLKQALFAYNANNESGNEGEK